MALSIEQNQAYGGGQRVGDRFAKGLKFNFVAFRVQPADYGATGLNLKPLMAQLGFGKIQGIIGQSWTTAPTGTPPTATLKGYDMKWDVLNQTVRAFSGGTEITGASIAANDLVRLIVIGG